MLTAHLSDTAARLYAARKTRDEIFGADRDGFGEPSWDMLLLLASADAQGRNVLEDELRLSAGVPTDIAGTYQEWLVSRELAIREIEQTADQTGFRLSDRGRELMAAYLERQDV